MKIIPASKNRPAKVELSEEDEAKIQEIAEIGPKFFFKETRSVERLRSLISTETPQTREAEND